MVRDHDARDNDETLLQVRCPLLGPVAGAAQGDRDHHDEQARGRPHKLHHNSRHSFHSGQSNQ